MNWTSISLAIATGFGTALCYAGAATDGSAGAVRQLSGAMQIPQSLGTVRGTNLFHSFAQFSIASGESALFTTSDASLRHVIARVTGGQASSFEGPLALLAAAGSRPDFWFVNPRGIVVGAGASFDVPAGLHLGSAPQLRFADGSALDAGSATGSSFSVAAPERFGFLGTAAAPLVVRDTVVAAAPQGTLTLAGGSIAVESALVASPGGEVRLSSPGAVRVGAGSAVGALAPQPSMAGAVRIEAGSLALGDADGTRSVIVSETGAQARGGGITMRLDGALTVAAGSEIRATQGAAGAGGIDLAVGRLAIDAGGERASISTWNLGDEAGAPLRIVAGGAFELRGGADVTSYGFGAGAGGAVSVTAGSASLSGSGRFGTTNVSTLGSEGGPGPLTFDVSGLFELRSGATIGVSSRSLAEPGALSVHARRLVVDGGGTPTTIGGLAAEDGPTPNVTVLVDETLRLAAGGQIYASTLGSRDGGLVRVGAARLEIEGSETSVTNVAAFAAGRGRGGSLVIDAGEVAITGPGHITTSTYNAAGGAGDITLRASRLTIDGRGLAAGIESFAFGAQGDAGHVRVQVGGEAVLRDGGSIGAGTLAVGNPGSVEVSAGTLRMDGRGATQAVTGIIGDSLVGGVGAAVTVQAGRIEIAEGSTISTSTSSPASGQPLRVVADTVVVDGGGNVDVATGISADTGGRGDAGSVTLVVRELTARNEGLITTSTLGSGRGGTLRVEAERLRFEHSGGLVSVAASTGDAGRIEVVARQSLEIVDGGFISANTGGAGAAGRIDVQAAQLRVSGSNPDNGEISRIASRARSGSSGRTGSLTIDVSGSFEIANGALLTIANDAQAADPSALTPTRITLRTGSLAMNGGEITAASSVNANAGSIAIAVADRATLVDSRIRTTAQDGDGGGITLSAGGVLSLRDSAVTTSVLGSRNGNGGDIGIAAGALLLRSGFVQANTAAARARGGNVAIDTRLLVPDGSNLLLGGSRIEQQRSGVPGFNVIQAAAPEGLSGRLEVTQPELNLSGSLVALFAQRIDFGALGRDLCEVGAESSFSLVGRGALRAPASAPLRLGR